MEIDTEKAQTYNVGASWAEVITMSPIRIRYWALARAEVFQMSPNRILFIFLHIFIQSLHPCRDSGRKNLKFNHIAKCYRNVIPYLIGYFYQLKSNNGQHSLYWIRRYNTPG